MNPQAATTIPVEIRLKRLEQKLRTMQAAVVLGAITLRQARAVGYAFIRPTPVIVECCGFVDMQKVTNPCLTRLPIPKNCRVKFPASPLASDWYGSYPTAKRIGGKETFWAVLHRARTF